MAQLIWWVSSELWVDDHWYFNWKTNVWDSEEATTSDRRAPLSDPCSYVEASQITRYICQTSVLEGVMVGWTILPEDGMVRLRAIGCRDTISIELEPDWYIPPIRPHSVRILAPSSWERI